MDTLQILRSLRDSFVENGHEEAVLVTKDSGKADTDVLVTLHRSFGRLSEEVQGLFYFSEDSGMPLFICRLILGEDLPDDAVLPICTEIALLNPTLPFGAFAFDPLSAGVEYTFQLPVDESRTEKELLAEADMCAALSLSVAELNVHTLQEIIGSYGV